MKPKVPVLILLCLLTVRAHGKTVDEDLTLGQYKQLESALTQGDPGKLPSCQAGACADDLEALVQASLLRIQWNLPNSMREASRCMKLARATHVATYYTCTRLVNADATSLYNLYGNQSTIGALADAVQRACEAHLWGNSGSCASSPIVVDAARMKGLMLSKEIFNVADSRTSIPLTGNGQAQNFVSDGKHPFVMKLVVNYPSVHVRINGKDALMRIDTGAQTSVIYASSAKRLGISVLEGLPAGSTGLTGATYASQLGIADRFEFGNISIQNKYVNIQNVEPAPMTDGIIGFDVLDKTHAFMFTKDLLIFNPAQPVNCNESFTVSSDFYGHVNGIRARNVTFNGTDVVAVLDTGNGTSAISPTWTLVKRLKLPVSDQGPIYTGDVGSAAAAMESGTISGTFDYLGKSQTGSLRIGANYPFGGVDFNIGAPFFYGKNLYVNFDRKILCMSR